MLSRLSGAAEVIRQIGGTVDSSAAPIKFYESLGAMEAALETGEVNQISTYKFVADYLAAQNPKLEIVSETDMTDSLCFVLRADDEVLKRQLDVAIEDMTRDGVLERFTKEYISERKENGAAVNIENAEGLTPLRFVVTGDLPPLDMLDAAGNIDGFNAAVLNELGRRLARNIEVVKADSASRDKALQTDEADVIFWSIVPSHDAALAKIDLPEGLTATSPYFTGKVVRVGLKNN